MREIRCPIQGVNVPPEIRSPFATGAFLRDDAVIGKVFCQLLYDGPFRAFVRLGHQVRFAFVGDVRRPVELLAENFAGVLCNFDRDFKIVFRHREHAPCGPNFIAPRRDAFYFTIRDGRGALALALFAGRVGQHPTPAMREKFMF